MSKQSLLCPAVGPGWDVWTFKNARRAGQEQPSLSQTAVDPAVAAQSGTQIVVALPVSQCLTFSVWLPSSDPSLHGEMIFSQIERRGLATRGRDETVLDHCVVASVEDRVLVRVTVLAGEVPAALCLSNAQSFAVSPSVFALPENQFVLWQEHNQLVLAANRGGALVYAQVLSRSAELSPQIAQQINSIRLALEMERSVERIVGVTLWGDFSEAQNSLAGLNLPVYAEQRPVPSGSCIAAVASRAGLLPLPLQALRRSRSRQNQNIRTALFAGAAYLAIVWLLWAYLGSLQKNQADLLASMANDGPIATELGRTAACWRAIEPAVNPKLYAIEQFYQCANVLPPAGIRFSSFETLGTDIRMKGIARNAATVFRLVEDLKRNPGLSGYQWKMGQPKLQKDDSAEFKLEGSLSYGKAK